MTTVNIIKSFILFCVFSITQVRNQGCLSRLGMEDGRIKDSQITTSSVLEGGTPYGGQARLNHNIPAWGGWCPDITGGKRSEKNYDQYIQIDLLNLTKITGIATQGREFFGGIEYVRDYKISYRTEDGGVWDFYRGKDQTVKIFQGNTDVFTVVRHNLDPAIMARYIRIHPGYNNSSIVCMRLELYGCVPLIKKAILFYSMPIGHITRNFQAFFQDISYSGIIANGVYKDGTGILTDDKFGPDDAKEYGGEGWVGWSNILTTSSYIDITFAFTGLRKFKDVTLTVNVDGKRSYAAFNRSQIFFAPTNDGFSETSFLQYYPGKSVDSNDPYIRNITLSLCENTARFIKLRLYFGGEWLLITEISFNSDCPTKPPIKDSSDSNNPQLTIIIICVILLIVILLLVGIFLLYRRQVLCFGKMRHWKINKDHDGEIPMSERSPDAQDHDIPINDETGPYEEVSNSPNSAYAELDRNRRVENTSDSTYQKLLKPFSDYVIPADADESSYELVPDSSPSVYAELKRNQENTSDNIYQKLLKPASDYVIPAENHSYEEVGKKRSPPGYTELDQTKREDADASYQKLLKK